MAAVDRSRTGTKKNASLGCHPLSAAQKTCTIPMTEGNPESQIILSICIPTFQREAWVDSLLQQIDHELAEIAPGLVEVCVIDNADLILPNAALASAGVAKVSDVLRSSP